MDIRTGLAEQRFISRHGGRISAASTTNRQLKKLKHPKRRGCGLRAASCKSPTTVAGPRDLLLLPHHGPHREFSKTDRQTDRRRQSVPSENNRRQSLASKKGREGKGREGKGRERARPDCSRVGLPYPPSSGWRLCRHAAQQRATAPERSTRLSARWADIRRRCVPVCPLEGENGKWKMEAENNRAPEPTPGAKERGRARVGCGWCQWLRCGPAAASAAVICMQ
jgi:hypothetical protein